MNPVGVVKKAFAIFKKKSKQAEERPADAPFDKDDNVVLVFGHSNSGKTVYFSVLYELLKGQTGFKLSPLDNATAQALIENYNIMRGKQLKIKEGRQVEIEGERRFPTMTSETRILKFGLDLHSRKGVKFYTVDYKGETLSIAEPGELRAQFAKFFPYCRAALFLIDASVLDTDVLLREQVAAFQTIIHDLRDCVSKRVPIGIVITKSDFLEGFSPVNPVELISGMGALYKGRRKESFIRGVTRANSRRFGEVWGRTTERITSTLGNLIDSMVSYNLDFQFFIVTATGGLAKKASGEVEPPSQLKPFGVEVPLQWAFRRILFNKRKYFWWHKVKWVCALCIIWAILFSAVNVWHMAFWYSDLDRANTGYEKDMRSYEMPLSESQAGGIAHRYDKYLSHWAVSDFFGASGLWKYAKDRTDQIWGDVDYSKADVATSGSGGGGGGWNESTMAARDDYNKLVEQLDKVPPGDRKTEFDKMIAEFWQNHDPKTDSLSPGFVDAVNRWSEKYDREMGDFLDKPMSLELEVQGLQEYSQVTIQIGSEDAVFFSNMPRFKPVKEIKGKPTAAITFTYRRLKQPDFTPLTEAINDPLKDFYPKLKAGGYTLDFGANYGLKVLLVKGSVPQPPKLNTL